MIRVSDYVMKCLADAGIKHVFQVTGRGALFLNDALAKSSELSAISLHHEQSCAYAAIAYAEQSKNIGACLVSTGCASTNAITGVLSAWQDAVPCVFISGQNTLAETTRYTGLALRTYGQQEADIIKLVEPITKFARMITSPCEIFELMQIALNSAVTGRMGPVWIDIPLDIQSALIDPEANLISNVNHIESIHVPNNDDVEAVVSLINQAERPVILIGSGVRASSAEVKLKKFVESLQIPIVYSASGADIYGSANKLSIGSVGAMGCSRAGNFAIQNSDFVLVLGSRLSSLTTGTEFAKFARDARCVVVDIDSVEHTKKTVKIDRFVCSDISIFLDSICKHVMKKTSSAWVKKCLHWKEIFGSLEPEFSSDARIDLYQLADALSALLPNCATVITDSGLAEVILPTNMKFKDGMRCIHPVSQGAMGFALPAAIGAQAATNNLVLTVIGDGSIMMNLQELESIVYNKLPIKIIVINNNVYSIIRRRQRELFRKRTIGTDIGNGISCPDFEKVANAFSLPYMRIETALDLDIGLNNLFSSEGPILCEIMGRFDQEYIETSQTRSIIDNRFVRRPLEDQFPFLSRDLFLKEMIVKPIDQ